MMRRALPVILILVLHAGILLQSAWRKSTTVDELGHLSAGLYSITNNDFRCNRLSPPLQNLICAAPVVLFGDYRLSYDHACWEKGIWNGLGERFAEANPQTFHRNLAIGRTGTMFLSVLLCLVIFLWANELWGYASALGVLTLAVLEPNFLAHGRLTTADTAPALLFLATGYLTWRFLKGPNWKRLISIGVVFGLTWASKHSGPVLVPTLLAVFAIVGSFHSQPVGLKWIPFARKGSGWIRSIRTAVGLTVVIFVIGLLVIWACYGFEVGDKIEPSRAPKSSLLWEKLQVPLQTGVYLLGLEERFPFDSSDVNDPFWRLLRNWTPAFSHWEGFCANQTNASRGSATFFMGETSYRTRYSYYPLLFLFKTPLALLLLFLIGVFALAARCVRLEFPAFVVGILFPSIYLFILMRFNHAYIGYRHALPAVPFLLVFLGGAAFHFLWSKKDRIANSMNNNRRFWERRILVALLLLWTAFDVLSVHPHYLPYFNTLAGGPDNGNLIAVDSNLDWGQDLFYLKDYLRERGLEDAYLIYFGPKSMPKAYGVPYREYKEHKTIQPGTYVISASMLRQYIASHYLPELAPLVAASPEDLIAHTLFVFRIDKK